MTRFGITRTRRLAGIGVLAVALVPPSALAAGTLSFSTSAAPTASVTLNGVDQTTTYTIPTTVSDSRGGVSAGWNLTITSTSFSTGSGTLPDTASTITSTPAVACQSGCGGAIDPVNTVLYPVAVPAGSTQPSATTFFNALANTGQGNFNVTPTVQVAVPASTFAGTYTSTITLAVVSGP